MVHTRCLIGVIVCVPCVYGAHIIHGGLVTGCHGDIFVWLSEVREMLVVTSDLCCSFDFVAGIMF